MKQIIYGRHAALEAIQNPKRNIHHIYVADAAYLEIVPQAELVTPKVLAQQAPKDAHHQDIVVIASCLPYLNIEDLASSKRVLVLDQITDPQNFGAILRTAAVLGIDAILTLDYRQLLESPVMIRIASGGLEHVPIVPVSNIARALEQLKGFGFWCYGLSHKAQISLQKQDLSGKVAIVVGAEGKGLRVLTQKTCDVLLSIPSASTFRVLNVSQATAIALYELSRYDFL